MSKTKRMVTVRHNGGKPIRVIKFPSRNERCLCFSGKKFKDCHLGKEDELISIVRSNIEKLKNLKKDEQKRVD
jgi:sugar lactone lactonase YvrE